MCSEAAHNISVVWCVSAMGMSLCHQHSCCVYHVLVLRRACCTSPWLSHAACVYVSTCVWCCVQGAADAAAEGEDDDGADFLLKDNGDDLDLRLERLEVGVTKMFCRVVQFKCSNHEQLVLLPLLWCS